MTDERGGVCKVCGAYMSWAVTAEHVQEHIDHDEWPDDDDEA